MARSSRSQWVHHCNRAARTLSRADFEPLKTVGKGQWGKVFLVRKVSGPVAGRAAGDPALVGDSNKVILVELGGDHHTAGPGNIASVMTHSPVVRSTWQFHGVKRLSCHSKLSPLLSSLY